MKFVNFMKRGGLIACVLLLAFVLDFALAQSYWVRDSGYFWLDDFELTQREHPEEIWDKVIYGSSCLLYTSPDVLKLMFNAAWLVLLACAAFIPRAAGLYLLRQERI